MFYKESLAQHSANDVPKPDYAVGRMLHRVFVGGLCKSTSEEVLFQYFSQFGDVSHVEIARSPNRKSKGYGSVIFEKSSSAQKASRQGPHTIEGQKLRVEGALDDATRRAFHQELCCRRLYLSGIPRSATQTQIYDLLRLFGEPIAITKFRRSNPYSNPNSFYCYVTMDRPSTVARILQIGSLALSSSRRIQVKPVIPTKSMKLGELSRPVLSSNLRSCQIKHSNIQDELTYTPEASQSTICSPNLLLTPYRPKMTLQSNKTLMFDDRTNHHDSTKQEFLEASLKTRQEASNNAKKANNSVRQEYLGEHIHQVMQTHADARNLRFNLCRPAFERSRFF